MRTAQNDHARALLAAAKERDFAPRCVVFDSWYSSLENLKAIREQAEPGSPNSGPIA